MTLSLGIWSQQHMQLSKSISFLISSQQSLKDKAMILLSEVGTGAPTLFCMSPEPKAWPLAKAEPESDCPPRHKEITYTPAAPSAWPHLLGPGASSGLLRVAGAEEAATAGPGWTHPGTPSGPRGWTGRAWQGWSLAVAADRPRSGGSPRRSRSSRHPGPL